MIGAADADAAIVAHQDDSILLLLLYNEEWGTMGLLSWNEEAALLLLCVCYYRRIRNSASRRFEKMSVLLFRFREERAASVVAACSRQPRPIT
jgi:hypothetical protein